jgi:hypothetical protein
MKELKKIKLSVTCFDRATIFKWKFLGLLSGLFLCGLPTNNLYTFLFSTFCAIFSAYHPPRHDYSNYSWRRVQIMKYSLCSLLQPPVTSSLFGPNIIYPYFKNFKRLQCNFKLGCLHPVAYIRSGSGVSD